MGTIDKRNTSPTGPSEDGFSARQDLRMSRYWLVLAGFAAIAGALLFTEHRAHVLGLLIWLPLLACPLMHIYMHRGHGGHGDHPKPPSRIHIENNDE